MTGRADGELLELRTRLLLTTYMVLSIDIVKAVTYSIVTIGW